MDQRSAILDLALTRLSAEDRNAYTAIIDDILAEYSAEVISSDEILEMLREKLSLALTRQRHHIRLLIIQRLRMLPIPQTVALTPSADHDTASGMAAAIFNVQELLDSVLFYLPVADLVRSRRINKTLHRVIETSTKLQRKLFLLPTNDSPKYWGWEHKNGITEFVTTLNSPPPPAPAAPRRRKRRRPDIIARLHPLIEADEWDHILSPDETLAVKLVFDTRIDRRILNSKVWPEMYLTSPPCTGVRIDFVYSDEQKQTMLCVKRDVYDPAGVTFATVWNALHKEGDITVMSDFSPRFGCYGRRQKVEGTTVREQIDGHRRRGVILSICEAQFALDRYSVTMMSADTEFEGLCRQST
jgi:hypothetical protein